MGKKTEVTRVGTNTFLIGVFSLIVQGWKYLPEIMTFDMKLWLSLRTAVVVSLSCCVLELVLDEVQL